MNSQANKTNRPKVSVVMCCYNAERFVKETIDSVLGQSFTDFEFIIWNDGSTDGSRQIIESYTDTRIRVFNDINRGEGKAAQLACEQAQAPYIARVDSDDVWLPTKLKEEYDYMESHPDVVMVSCPMIYIDKDSHDLGLTFPVTKVPFLTKSIKVSNRFVHSGSMYRTEAYKKTRGYKDLRLFQDWLLFSQLGNYGHLALMPRPLIKYRLLPNSIMHRIEKSPYLPVIREFQKKIIREQGAKQEDLELFNALYKLIGKTSDDDGKVYEPDLKNKIYNFLKPLMGDRRAYKLVTWMVNVVTR